MINFILKEVCECCTWFGKIDENNFIEEELLRYDIK